MKDCLQCGKEFKPERDSAKYCSTKCRVMWHRKNPDNKPKGLSPVQEMKVMYNAILEKIEALALPAVTVPVPNQITGTKGLGAFIAPMQTGRSFEDYQRAKIECENEDQWRTLKAEILNSDLSQKQKSLLTQR